MKPTSSMEFIDTALFESSSFKLSYKDPNQKWLIRKHLLKFFEKFPNFIPSTDKHDQFDGTTMNLINISGFLLVSDFLPEVPLIIWIHENYPFMSPMIFIPSNPEFPIRENHPFIDHYSGYVTPPYILNWDEKTSNLCELIHNLVNLFQNDHPSISSYTMKQEIQDDLDAMPSSILKATLLNDLVAKISVDLAALDVDTQHDIEKESNKQAELEERGDDIDDIICTLLEERGNLEKRVVELKEYNDKLLDWLSYSKNAATKARFDVVGEKSKMVDCRAANKALDDVMYALDKALEQGVISLDVYMKQVRVLAREQFFTELCLLS